MEAAEEIAARVTERLGVESAHRAWLAKLDAAGPPAGLPAPDPDVLSALLDRLGVAPEDAAEVLRTLPSPEGDPDSWWLLERSHALLARGLADRDNDADPLPSLPAALRLFPAHLILLTVDAIRERHRAFGIPDDVSWETLSYLGPAMTAYRARHGAAGIDLSGWDWLRFFGVLYQVGRLTVIPYRLCVHPEAGPLFWYDDETTGRLGAGFRRGDPALSIHISASDRLMPASCDESLRRLRTAFVGTFPGETVRVATCTSWLLDDQLSEYLPAHSNILAFQRRFRLVPGERDDDESILGLVFGAERPKDLEALPQGSTLERAVVHHLRLGRHWRMQTGWLDLADEGPSGGVSPIPASDRANRDMDVETRT